MAGYNVEVEGLGKCYRAYGGPMKRIIETATLGRVRGHRPIWALRNVDLRIKPGGSVGLCGANGAGKSTLLKVLAGTTTPSEGRFRINGRVSSLLELGTGFHMEFTGRDNIISNGIMMGFSKRVMESKIDEIIDFAELGDYIDEPVRTYSSGMGLRLGFSVAMAVEPDVMIIDEVFAVGDMYFQKKCVDKVYDLKRANKTLIFCSHSLYDIRQLCDDALWLRDGAAAALGASLDVTNEYSSYQRAHIQEHEDEEEAARDEGSSSGDVVLPRILDARMYAAGTDEELYQIETGQSVEIRIWWTNPDPVKMPIQFGIALFESQHTIVAGIATHYDRFGVGGSEGCTVAVFPGLPLLSGNYLIGVIMFDGQGTHHYQEYLLREMLQVRCPRPAEGLFEAVHHWEDRTGTPRPEGGSKLRESDWTDVGGFSGETGGWPA